MGRVAKLHAVEEREGNPTKRPIPQGVKLPPNAPPEPDWHRYFPPTDPKTRAANLRMRKVASGRWKSTVAIYSPLGILAEVDLGSLSDLCVLAARVEEGERQLSLGGMVVKTDRGMVKNPLITAMHGWRASYWSAMRDFGMTPLSRDRLNPREPTGDGNDDFDV